MKISSLREYIALNVKLGQVMIKAAEKKKRTITREEANRVIIEDSINAKLGKDWVNPLKHDKGYDKGEIKAGKGANEKSKKNVQSKNLQSENF